MSKTGWVVECNFVSIKRWFRSGKAVTNGLARVHAQHLMQAMAHNLYSSPGIIISCT
ncbi:MAG: hypothetical protein ACMUEL_00985 [Flavobacteriales bacterium Tduv]